MFFKNTGYNRKALQAKIIKNTDSCTRAIFQDIVNFLEKGNNSCQNTYGIV